MKKHPHFKNKTILEILENYKTLWALGHLGSLAGWDIETYMPQKGIRERGESLAKLSSLSQKIFLDKSFVSLIKKAQKARGLNDYEKGVVRKLTRELKQYEKLPAEFLEEFERTTSQAKLSWRQAKKENNFKLFEPHLKKIVELSRKQAEYLGYKEHPYDALIDLFEEGWTTKEVEDYFNTIQPRLTQLLGHIRSSGNYQQEHPLEHMPYDKNRAAKLNQNILEFLNYDPGTLRLDVSAHPFTQGLGIDDVRITTWYHDKDFARFLLATIHEYGHALHKLQYDKNLAFTPLSAWTTLGIGESQSRFWENFVGRSQKFIKTFQGNIAELSPQIKRYVQKHGTEGVYRYLNLVRPGLIRVEADEITYHSHIKLRFDIEKSLVEGSVKVKDLPEVWNETIKKYLGIKPKTHTEGVLQDIHWSMGAIGYFPTYSIGTFVSGIWKDEFEKKHGNIEQHVSRKGVKNIQDWLAKRVHRYGSTYTLKDLLHASVKRNFDPESNLKYLEKKYKRPLI